MVNSTCHRHTIYLPSTTVEIYMVNSTHKCKIYFAQIYNSRNLYGQFDRYNVIALCIIYNSRNLYGQFDLYTKDNT